MGEARDAAGNIWETDAQGNAIRFLRGPSASPASPRVLVPADPVKMRREERAEESASRSAGAAERSAGAAERSEDRNTGNDRFSHVRGLANDYNSDPSVKAYRVAISQLGQGLSTGEGAQADLALTYAFAKAMDPESVVRESEQGMVTNSQPWFQAAVENAKKQFGMDGAGLFTPQAREALRSQIANSVAQRVKVYDARRNYFTDQAKALGVEPNLVVGEHDAKPFIPALQEWGKQRNAGKGDKVRSPVDDKIAAMLAQGKSAATIKAYAKANNVSVPEIDSALAWRAMNPGYKGAYDVSSKQPEAGYDESIVGQAMSGGNEGLAGVLGLPVDAVTAGINLIPKGINALANTNIPTIDNPTLGSQWLKDRMAGWAIKPPTDDAAGQVARRVGQSVGASVVPAGMAGSLARAGGQFAVGAGGGIGGAAAQQAFPGNPLAEMAGEVAGGGVTGMGILNASRRNAQRQIEAAVPTVPQLKDQAGELYRAAESRGVVADPTMTQSLADDFRGALAAEGRVSPTGRISEVYPKAREAQQLIDDYAGSTMTPTQMQTVRKVASDGLTATDGTERRLGRILTDTFDQWANPLAPELSEARDVASRYLTAEQLGRARDLAGAKASQFTGSGFENALRTEYRGLDRAAIKGNARFNDDVIDAIEKVSRGTPASNFARGVGKLAPTGVVSLGLGSGLPAMGAMMAGSGPMLGGAIGASVAGLGGLGRLAATNMGIRAADQAELVARNGGALDVAPLVTQETLRAMQALVAAQSAKYLPGSDEAAVNQEGQPYPGPLPRGKRQRHFPAAPLRR